MTWWRPILLKKRGRAKIQEKATSFSWTPHKASWNHIQPQRHLILLCAQMWMTRRSARLPVYCARFSMAPLFFWNNSKQFELNTGEPSCCYSTKTSTVSPLWKGHRVKKTVGTFKTDPRFPPLVSSWTSTLRFLFDSDNKNVQGKCAINKSSIAKINWSSIYPTF